MTYFGSSYPELSRQVSARPHFFLRHLTMFAGSHVHLSCQGHYRIERLNALDSMLKLLVVTSPGLFLNGL